VLAGKHISRARCRRSATGKKGECSLTGPSLFFGTMQGLCCRVFDRDQRDRTDNGAQQRIARSGLAAIESGSALRPLDSFPLRTVFQSIQRTGESTKPKARPSIGGPARARSRGRARKNPIPAREFVYPRHLNAASTPLARAVRPRPVLPLGTWITECRHAAADENGFRPQDVIPERHVVRRNRR